MSGFVVWVDFRLKPGARGRFRELVDANATASVRSEAGCRRFDVTQARGEPDRV
ncbi:antibiotic biosynthesis monooxygenase, partial [Mesorhizobium sp. M7A.F.Ca.US.006.04.2.1]